jgi:hypothetical protein
MDHNDDPQASLPEGNAMLQE